MFLISIPWALLAFLMYLFFLLGTVALLKINKTEPVPEDQSTTQTRGLLASKIVASLQQFRFRITSDVSEVVQARLEELFGDDDFGFDVYVVIPFLFLFLSLFVALLIPFFSLFFLVSFIFTAVFGIVTTSVVPSGASRVPSFYAPVTRSDSWSRILSFALFGVIFGGLHCIGWNFKFPTNSEQTLWRYTSLTITIIPLIVAPIDFLLATRLHDRDIKSCRIPERLLLLTLDLIMTILLFIYVPSRLSLIAQAPALLRSLPPDALTAIDWTKYVPHLLSS